MAAESEEAFSTVEDFYARLFAFAERLMGMRFPAWLPFQVRVWASLLVTTGFDPVPVRRLATDPRMRAVWTEIGKHHRGAGGHHFHQSRPRATKEDQQTAMARLFSDALLFHDELPFATSRSELKQLQTRNRQRASEARRMKAELISRGASAASVDRLPLFPDAAFFDQMAQTADVEPRVQVVRRRTNPQLRGFLVALLSQTRFLFGSPLYGIVATMASVLTERNIRRSLVRQCDFNQAK
jgi:hypothetical protein